MGKSKLVLVIGYIIVAGLLIFLFSAGILQIVNSNNNRVGVGGLEPSKSPFILNASSTPFSLVPIDGTYAGTLNLEYGFNITSPSRVQGTMNSTPQGGESFIVAAGKPLSNPTQYYTYSSDAQMSLVLPDGQYYLVFEDLAQVPVNITITQSFVITPL